MICSHFDSYMVRRIFSSKTHREAHPAKKKISSILLSSGTHSATHSQKTSRMTLIFFALKGKLHLTRGVR